MKTTVSMIVFLLFAFIGGESRSYAGLILNLHDNFTTVEYTVSGHLDGITLGSPTSTGVTPPANGSVSASTGELLILGDSASYQVHSVTLFGSIATFGTGSLQTTTGTSSGDLFGLFVNGGSAEIWLPSGYQGGNVLSATGEWNGSLASLGLTTGTYLTSIRTPAGFPIAVDTIAINISEAPEPSGFVVLGLSTLFMLKRRKRKA